MYQYFWVWTSDFGVFLYDIMIPCISLYGLVILCIDVLCMMSYQPVLCMKMWSALPIYSRTTMTIFSLISGWIQNCCILGWGYLPGVLKSHRICHCCPSVVVIGQYTYALLRISLSRWFYRTLHSTATLIYRALVPALNASPSWSEEFWDNSVSFIASCCFSILIINT